MAEPPRRFPSPWRIIEMAGCFIVQEANRTNVAWFFFRDDPTVAPSVAPTPKAKAKQRAANFAGRLLGKARHDCPGCDV
jgi:hypothetical protein